MKIKTGDVVLNYLIENKVKHVFLITGGAIGFLIELPWWLGGLY